METTEQKQANPTREQLKTLSNSLKPLVKAGVYDSVNEAIVSIYKNEEHQEFKKFWDWKKQGYTILKGSKAFAVWAQPVKNKKPDAKEDADEYEFFPICFLFSNAQVIRRAQNV